ncbi:MAG: polysaccharide deacetylase family protein [Deltaproteobacteria bacterium]|nr:polysaccharide deacetylase family protein [Deltaproteobacteria bacterium]
MMMTLSLLSVLATLAAPAHGGDGFVLSLAAPNEPFEKVMADVERAHAIGATHFNIALELCQKDRHANEIHWCATDAPAYKDRVLRIARELKRRGYGSGLLPIAMGRDDGAWRGFFEPTDFDAWGRSYLALLLEMADLAREAELDDLVAGTELNRLFIQSDPREQARRTAYWRSATNEARKRVGPKTSVILVSNWDQFEQIPFWDASDYIAMSAYYPLASSDHKTSVPELVAGWKKWQERLVRVAERNHKKLYFSEVGYASVKGAAREPWNWEGELDLDLQRRLYEAFTEVWATSARAGKLARFQLWALDIVENPARDTGFCVFGKPAEAALRTAFERRGTLLHEQADAGGRPVLITVDDVPMWFVSDIQERVRAYDTIRETLVRHGVPGGVAFVNPAFVTAEEWPVLARWREAGFVFANHTARHKARSDSSESEFLGSVDEADSLLAGAARLGAPVARAFRYPNLDFGAKASDRETTCRRIRERGHAIWPVSFDSRDWSWSEKYHFASGAPEGSGSQRAKAIVAEALATIDAQFASAPVFADGSALVLLIHSTRFTRDQLDTVLTRLERQGARWVAPEKKYLAAYEPAGDSCLPICKKNGTCF